LKVCACEREREGERVCVRERDTHVKYQRENNLFATLQLLQADLEYNWCSIVSCGIVAGLSVYMREEEIK